MPVSPVMPILVVDDFPLLGATIAALLKMEGFEDVDVAHGGPQALKKIQARTYDLVISDLRMPGVDGLELFEAMRREHKLERTRFMIVSGHVAPSEVGPIKQQGVDAVLLKPFRPDALKQAIEDVFAGMPAAA